MYLHSTQFLTLRNFNCTHFHYFFFPRVKNYLKIVTKPGKMSENSNVTCVVCYKNFTVYSIGMCEHPVCFECSTRMRVLCQQNECPICRQDLPKVVFTRTIQPYRHLRKTDLYNPQYRVYFDDLEIKNLFDELLSHWCKLCPDALPYETFYKLKDHMRREHELHFCDLCVKDLKVARKGDK